MELPVDLHMRCIIGFIEQSFRQRHSLLNELEIEKNLLKYQRMKSELELVDIHKKVFVLNDSCFCSICSKKISDRSFAVTNTGAVLDIGCYKKLFDESAVCQTQSASVSQRPSSAAGPSPGAPMGMPMSVNSSSNILNVPSSFSGGFVMPQSYSSSNLSRGVPSSLPKSYALGAQFPHTISGVDLIDQALTDINDDDDGAFMPGRHSTRMR